MSATGDPAPGDRWAREAGATLIEMLVVMGVLTLAVGLIFPAFRKPYDAVTAQAARAAVLADLRRARARAVVSEQPVAFAVDADGGGYGWPGGRMQAPASVRLAGAPLRFEADGTARGGAGLAVIRRASGAAWRFAIEPATGLARVEPGG